jgi:hypothetical protein
MQILKLPRSYSLASRLWIKFIKCMWKRLSRLLLVCPTRYLANVGCTSHSQSSGNPSLGYRCLFPDQPGQYHFPCIVSFQLCQIPLSQAGHSQPCLTHCSNGSSACPLSGQTKAPARCTFLHQEHGGPAVPPSPSFPPQCPAIRISIARSPPPTTAPAVAVQAHTLRSRCSTDSRECSLLSSALSAPLAPD